MNRIWYGDSTATVDVREDNNVTKDDLHNAVLDVKKFIELTSNYCNESKNKETYKPRTIKVNIPKIKNIDFQPPLTVVIWEDGTKTFVKCKDDEEFDPEKGAAMAIAKKALGDKYNYIKTISYYVDKWLKKDKNKDYIVDKFTNKEKSIIKYIRECEEDREEVTDYILGLCKEIYWNK